MNEHLELQFSNLIPQIKAPYSVQSLLIGSRNTSPTPRMLFWMAKFSMTLTINLTKIYLPRFLLVLLLHPLPEVSVLVAVARLGASAVTKVRVGGRGEARRGGEIVLVPSWHLADVVVSAPGAKAAVVIVVVVLLATAMMMMMTLMVGGASPAMRRALQVLLRAVATCAQGMLTAPGSAVTLQDGVMHDQQGKACSGSSTAVSGRCRRAAFPSDCPAHAAPQDGRVPIILGRVDIVRALPGHRPPCTSSPSRRPNDEGGAMLDFNMIDSVHPS